MTKITALPLDSSPSGTDYIPTVDTSDITTKKTLLSSVRTYVGANFVNPYMFSAYMGSTQSTVLNTWTKLNMNTEEYDTNSNYSTSTYGYTIPVTGYYTFNVGVQMIGQAGVPFLVAFSKDGTTEWRRAQEIPNTTGNIAIFGNVDAYLTTGEVIYPIYYSSSAGKTLNNTAGYSRFQGRLISL